MDKPNHRAEVWLKHSLEWHLVATNRTANVFNHWMTQSFISNYLSKFNKTSLILWLHYFNWSVKTKWLSPFTSAGLKKREETGVCGWADHLKRCMCQWLLVWRAWGQWSAASVSVLEKSRGNHSCSSPCITHCYCLQSFCRARAAYPNKSHWKLLCPLL